jgi:solute carrier family 25 folate transporter 32
MANNSDFKDVPLPAQHIVAAMSAGAVGDIITNPLWVVRTRIQTRVLHKSSTVSSAPGIMEMARYILRKEDFFSFYRGLGASFLGLSHVAVQFPVYEMLKAKAAARRANGEVHMVDVLVSSIVAKTIASFLTYPHEVIRARLQDLHGGDKGIIGIIRTTVKEEGFFSLWNGLKVNVVRVIPATISTFVAYEYISKWLSR